MGRLRIPPAVLTFIILLIIYTWFSRRPRQWVSEKLTRFPSFSDDGSSKEGKTFPSVALEIAQMNSAVVFVTYASDNHYLESRNAIHYIRQMTDATIIYYDLGLNPEYVEELKSVCNLRLITFNFAAYPPHVKTLYTYAFKPILIAEMYREYSAFWVIDASARLFNETEMYKFYDKVRKGEVDSFSAAHPEGHAIHTMTASGMFDYLPLPQKERNSGMIQANTMFISRNLLCSLIEKCIVPEGAKVDCTGDTPNCHRFDQSSLSIVMCASRLRRGLPCLSRSATRGAYSDFFGVERDTEYTGPLPKC